MMRRRHHLRKDRLVMKSLRLAALAALIGLVHGSGARSVQAAAPGALLDILRSELQRNFTVLGTQQTPAYFIGYTVHDERSSRISASFGALDLSDESRGRFGTVEVRVGDYALDNTHPIRGDSAGTSPRTPRLLLPLTDDAAPIQLAFWRATDRAFKQGNEALTRVQTNVAAKVREESPAPDFSREQPQTYTGAAADYILDTKAWEARLRRVSAPFAEDPLIFSADVSLSVNADTRYYVNSEGAAIVDGDVQCRIFVQAMTKADDGMELPLYTSYFSRTVDGLPDEQKLIADVRDMMRLLAGLRKAPIVDPYSGPAILSGRAAGVFFHEIFGHRVEGHRQRDADEGQTFGRKVDELVLPEFLSVVFDPTLERRGSTELMGYYRYDDEGVKARRVTVVDKGMLKTFLLGRAPLVAFPQSNGHGRAEAGYVPVSRQSNLIVEASRTVPSAQLVTMLKDEARRQGKPFGLLFDNIEGGFTVTGRNNPNAFNVMPNVVYRIYTDDRPPELVRGVDLIGTPLAAFGKFVAASDTVDVFNGVCGAESGNVPVSASSPELLVSEVEVQKKAQSQEALPILPAPQPEARPGRTF
jgi:predicted Zn-dependent protease